MSSTVKATIEIDGASQVLYLQPRVFSTGSRGYHITARVQAPDGTRYQTNLMLVEIGSKGTNGNDSKRHKK